MKREREIRNEFIKSGHLEHYEVLRSRKRGSESSLIAALEAVYKGKRWYEVEGNHRDLLQVVSYNLYKNESYLNMLRHVCEKGATVMLHHSQLRRALGYLSAYHRQMARSPKSWIPPKGNFRAKFNHLLRHTLCTYPVPAFMEKVWVEGNDDDRKFFLELAEGKPVYGNWFLRDAVLSRKMAHLFRKAPMHCSVIQAVRWAQLRSVRKDKSLFRAVANSFLGRSLENDDFWSQVLLWLARQEEVNYQQVRPVLRYIAYLKFGEFQIGEFAMPFPAPEPNFKLNGRTFQSVRRNMEDFHTQLKLEHGWENCSWTPAPLPNFQWDHQKDADGVPGAYRLSQLLNREQLVEEGIRLKHCVATYDGNCENGSCSIWSLRKVDEKGETPLVTIELDNHEMEVEQVKGFDNRFPNEFEIQLVREWAAQAKIEVPEYALS